MICNRVEQYIYTDMEKGLIEHDMKDIELNFQKMVRNERLLSRFFSKIFLAIQINYPNFIKTNCLKVAHD